MTQEPQWGKEEDAIVSRYEERTKEGLIKEIVIVPIVEHLSSLTCWRIVATDDLH